MLKVIVLFACIDLLLLIGAYFLLLRHFVPLKGYIGSFLLIVTLLAANFYVYEIIKTNHEEQQTSDIKGKCTKSYLEAGLNEVGSAANLTDKQGKIEEMLGCFSNPDQTILIREVAAPTGGETIAISAKPMQVSFKKYLRQLKELHLGDSIRIEQMRSDEQGRVIYLEVSEKHKSYN